MVQDVIEEIMITTTLLFIVVFLVTISTTYTSTVISHSAMAHGFESMFNALKTMLSSITDTCLCRDKLSQGMLKLFYPAKMAVKLKATSLGVGQEEFSIEIVLRIPMNIIKGGLHDYDRVNKAYCEALLEKWANSISLQGLSATYTCTYTSWSDGATAYYRLAVDITVDGCRGDEYDIPGIDIDYSNPVLMPIRTDYEFSQGRFICSLELENG